jgi:hypothetical protein
MDHDFSEFYQMCGSVMQSAIEDMIIHDKDHIKPKIRLHINACINYLLSMNDDIFLSKYMELYDIDVDNELVYVVHELYTDDAQLPTNYNKYDYVFACTSNILLINRCLLISKLPLIFAINRCTRRGAQMFINFDIESCKLLHSEGFDSNTLLSIAYVARDYDSIRYILMHMTDINLGDLIMDQRFVFYNLPIIYIIDKIHEYPCDFIKKLLKTKHFTDCDYYYGFIITCYYIVRYMSRKEGLSYLSKMNKHLDDKILLSKNTLDSWWSARKLLWNNLLEFHFRPRGGHTKASITI